MGYTRGYSQEQYRVKKGVGPHEHLTAQGKRVLLGAGDTFYPRLRELETFGFKFERVAAPSATPVEPETPPEEKPREPVDIPPPPTTEPQADAQGNYAIANQAPGAPTPIEDDDEEETDTDHGIVAGVYPDGDFASDAAISLWEEAGKLNLNDLPRSGYGGKAWNADDVRDALTATEDDGDEE